MVKLGGISRIMGLNKVGKYLRNLAQKLTESRDLADLLNLGFIKQTRAKPGAALKTPNCDLLIA